MSAARGAASASDTAGSRALAELLRHSRFEVLPLDGIEDEVLAHLYDAGVRELFVPAGDATDAAGEFNSAADLLAAMGPARTQFERIGITGYPESHLGRSAGAVRRWSASAKRPERP